MPVWSSAKRRLGQCLLSRNTFGVVGLGLRQTNAGLRRLNTPSLVQKPYNILFFGTDEFSIICLDRLRREQLENPGKLVSNIEVVTPPDNPRNKIAQVPLRLFASKHDITSHYAPPKSLRGWELPISMTRTPFDLAIVVSFGYFLPRSLIAQFRAGAFNIHPSLLPRHRGAAPLQHTILSGDTETGVSIIALDDKRFDTGEVLKQTRIPIASDVHYKELHDTLGRIGAEDMLRTLQDLERFKAEAKPQCEEGATKAPKVDKQDALIDWQDSADRIYRLHRAIGYRIPLWTHLNDRRVQLLNIGAPSPEKGPSHLVEDNLSEAPPGAVGYSQDFETLYIRCGDRQWLPCLELKIQDKKAMGAKAFHNGNARKKGVHFA